MTGPRQTIDPVLETQVSAISERLRSGSLELLEPGSYRVLLGAEVAARLGVAAGDTVVAAIAQGTVTPAGVVPRRAWRTRLVRWK